MSLMIHTGAKGSNVNLSQISCLLGTAAPMRARGRGAAAAVWACRVLTHSRMAARRAPRAAGAGGAQAARGTHAR